MNQNEFSLEVLVNGKPLKEYQNAHGAAFIEARIGTQYSLRVRNNSWKRVLVVSSVDGLDTLTGQTAEPNGGGYILNPWSSLEIKGFRESDSTVGSFLFTARAASYAASQGKGSNVGVIGIRIFDEEPQSQPVYIAPQPSYSRPTFSGSAPFITGCFGSPVSSNDQEVHFSASLNMTRSAAPQARRVSLSQPKAISFSVGSSWGKRVNDRVTHVEFERNNNVAAMDIFYASRSDLEAMGVRFVEETSVSFPQSFPTTYAKPPANWRG